MILVVDDDPHSLEPLATLLALQGVGVVTAANGADALAALEARKALARPIRGVILDLKMRPMDGLTLLREIRRADADLPVVVFTGLADERTEALEADPWVRVVLKGRDPEAILAAFKDMGVGHDDPRGSGS